MKVQKYSEDGMGLHNANLFDRKEQLMREKNAVTKEYVKNCRIFADAFNQLLYKGKRVIQPDRLHPLDTTELALLQGAEGTTKVVEKFRDVLKYLSVMEDSSAIYAILGVENQSEVHYAMPVRDMLYDALHYVTQIKEITDKHKQNRKHEKKPNNGEFLSGFYKEDRLVPVITLVLYFGTESWDGPKTLHEMLTVDDPEMLQFVSDYKINLFSPVDMSDEELNRFCTSLREVMLFMKYAKDKTKLQEMLKTDAGFRNLDREAANVISTITGTKIEMKQEKEEVDMCDAIREMLEDATNEGLQKGRESGIREQKKEMARKMLAKNFSHSEIMELTGLTASELSEIM